MIQLEKKLKKQFTNGYLCDTIYLNNKKIFNLGKTLQEDDLMA